MQAWLKIGGQKVPGKILLLIASDALLLAIGLATSVALRFQSVPVIKQYLSAPENLFRFAVVIVICILALYYNDLYNFELMSRPHELFAMMLQGYGTACVALALTYFVVPDIGLGRGIAVIAVLLIPLLATVWRIVMVRTGFLLAGAERVLIVGTAQTGIQLTRKIISQPELNLRVVGFLDERGENIGRPLVNPGVVGAVSDVKEIAESLKVQRVVLSLTERRGNMPVRALMHLRFAGVEVEDAHTVYERLTGRIVLEYLSPSWLILAGGFRRSSLLAVSKRVLDIICALVGLILLSPVILITAIAVRLESRGPILFRQERVGLHEKSFELLKFRSMHHNSEGETPRWAVENDERITRVGKIIRKIRFDELPQLINVLRGEMSLVGPRPERPYFVDLLNQKIPFYGLRHTVRPGVTGWAQVRYQYGGSIEEAKTKLEYDLFYVKHLSIMLDFAILFETAKVLLWQRGAK
jgi:sugar transferase (PEP-CTERM system associated)